MSGIELFVAKAILGPALSSGSKRVTAKLFGDDDVKNVVKICREALDAALAETLQPYEPVAREDKVHLNGVLAGALGLMADPVDSLRYVGSDGLTEVVSQVHSSEFVDWATFQIVHEGTFIRLDQNAILERFLGELPIRLRAAAGRHGSPLHNLVTQLDSVEIQHSLSNLARNLGALSPAGTTSTWPAAKARAITKQRDAINWRRSSDLVRAAYVEARAVRAWHQWDSGTDWHTRVLTKAAAVNDALDKLDLTDPGLQSFARELRERRMPYSSISIRLRDLRLTRIANHLVALAHAENASPHADRSNEQVTLQALRDVRWLSMQHKEPRYEYSLNLSGNFGSGRSRILTRIAQTVADRDDDFVLFLSPTVGETLRQALLRQSAQLFGRDFRDVADLAQILQDKAALHGRLWLFVDDLDQHARRSPDLIHDIHLLLDESTAWPALRWLLAVDTDQFESVLSREDRYFWVRFGHIPHGEDNPATGWLDVDASNSRQRLGLKILRELSEPDRADIAHIVDDTSAFSHENNHLANPLAAWMRFESTGYEPTTTSPVTDVNQADFIKDYWNWIRRRVAVGDAETAALERIVTQMARTFGRLDLPRLTVDSLMSAAAGSVATNRDRHLLLDLRAVGLVTLHWEGNPLAETQTEYATPAFAAFWGYRIAQTILFDTKPGADPDASPALHALLRAITQWQIRVNNGDSLAEATCQFTLALVEEFHSEIATETLWKRWATDATAPRVPLIMAATAGLDGRQRTAIDMISKRRYSPASKRELFVMLRLAHRSRLETWRAHDRLTVLRNHLAAITEHGLDTYYHQILQNVLGNPDLVTGNNYTNTCESLVGCERVGGAQLAADLAVRAGRRIYGDDAETWIQYVVRFCRRIAPSGDNKRKTMAKHGKGRQESRKKTPDEGITSHDKSTFVEKFIDLFVAHVINTWGTAGCRLLANYGWWTALEQGIDSPLARHMRSTLTTNFGAEMHRPTHDRNFADEYQAVVDEIMDGDLLPHAPGIDRWEVAFFLIKHSVPTYGRSDVVVDERFHPALTQLASEQSLNHKLKDQAIALYRANGIRLPSRTRPPYQAGPRRRPRRGS